MSKFEQEMKPRQHKPAANTSRARMTPAQAPDSLTPQQKAFDNQAIQQLLRSRVIQAKLRSSASGDPYEREADRAAEVVTGVPTSQAPNSRGMPNQTSIQGQHLSRIRPKTQRFPDQEAETPAAAEPMAETVPTSVPVTAGPTPETTPTPAEPTTEADGPTEMPAPGLLVEDATEVAPGQMRKSEFLAALRTEVCTAANEALTGTGRTTEGCPYLDYWFDYYGTQDSQHIERAMRRYAPETANATTAQEYIAPITTRVQEGVMRWARTGEVTGVPEDVPLTIAGGADHKWDISRRTRQHILNPAGIPTIPASDACLWSDLPSYPANRAEGNDDTHPGDENNDPYAGSGVLTSHDTPSDFILHTQGNDNDSLEIRAQFQEFARLELNSTWWPISDMFPWRFHIRTRKDSTTHRWVDNRTDAALDNSGF